MCPDVIMIQEHWLYPSNLFKLDEVASDYISFGSSAMNDKVGLGPFYGDTAILTKRELAPVVSNVISNERFTVIKLFDWLMLNVYMPCSGTLNRYLIYSDIIHEIQSLFSV